MLQDFLIQNSWLIAIAVASGAYLVYLAVTQAGVQGIGVAQATLLLNRKKGVLLDIRAAEAAKQSGLIPQAKLIDVDTLPKSAESLAKNKTTPLVVVCQNGRTSPRAVAKLKAAGYSEVYALQGGVTAWMEAGLPIKLEKKVG